MAALEPESLKLSHALWLSGYDDRIFGLLWALTTRRLDTPVVYHLMPPAAAQVYDQQVFLADGNEATQRRDLVVPVRVYVDASGVTLQLPSGMAVTLEHYGGQVQMLVWTAEDAGNDPTFKHAVDANLAATVPTE